jgi:hypothetical protein
MNVRTTSASMLALLAFATIAMAQPQQLPRTTPPSNTTPSSDTTTNEATTTDLDSKEHQFLAKFVGTWAGQATLHGVEGEAGTSKIACSNTLTFGHYVTSTFSGQIMNQPFQAVQTWGFNTTTGTFETTWIDNNSTGITFNNGSCNEDGTVFTIDGQVQDSDGSTLIQRSITTFTDSDHFTLDLVSVDPQNVSTPVMTIAFSRQAHAGFAPTDQAFSANTSGATNWSAASTTPTTPQNRNLTPAAAPEEMHWASSSEPFAQTHNQTSGQTPGKNGTAPLATLRRNVQVEVTSAQIDALRRTASENESKN